MAIDAGAIKDNWLREAIHEKAIGHFVSIRSDYYCVNPCSEHVYHFTPTGRSRISQDAFGVPYVYKDQPERFGHRRDKHCRGNAWHVPYFTTQSRADRDHHPASFPIRLAELCFRLADPQPDALVLDPFAGIGSTLLAAQALNLRVIGIEIDPAYCAAARRRLSEGAEL